MKPRHHILLLCTALGVAAPSAAQQPRAQQAEPGQSVTVTGERPDNEAERRREATRFFDSHAVRTRIGQLARWHDPICVRVWGLPGEMNARIASRVMEIADSLGIATNRADLCRPNVRIGFTSAPETMIERAFRRNSQVIGFHYAAQRNRLLRVRQPVQAWYVTSTLSGAGSGGTTGAMAERDSIQSGAIDDGGSRAPGGVAGSRLSAGISSGLAHVLIFADTRIVAGQEADSIAELLAFLALAQTPVAEACDASATILNLMNPACPPAQRPAALTRQDTAYLRALYRVDPTWGPQLQRGTLVGDMVNRLGGGR